MLSERHQLLPPPGVTVLKQLYPYFFRGLITALPVGLTVYLLYLFLSWSEALTAQLIRPFIGKLYIPGMGLLLGITGIFLLGVLVSQRGVGRLLSLLELPFTNLPVVKSIYSSFKSFADYFSPQRSHEIKQTVVILSMPGQPLEIVGLVTRHGVGDLPAGFLQGDRVAVYLPMGYMIGGYTVFVPRDWVQPIDMSVEEAMRQSMFAWMDGARGKPPVAEPEAPEGAGR